MDEKSTTENIALIAKDSIRSFLDDLTVEQGLGPAEYYNVNIDSILNVTSDGDNKKWIISYNIMGTIPGEGIISPLN